MSGLDLPWNLTPGLEFVSPDPDLGYGASPGPDF